MHSKQLLKLHSAQLSRHALPGPATVPDVHVQFMTLDLGANSQLAYSSDNDVEEIEPSEADIWDS